MGSVWERSVWEFVAMAKVNLSRYNASYIRQAGQVKACNSVHVVLMGLTLGALPPDQAKELRNALLPSGRPHFVRL